MKQRNLRLLALAIASAFAGCTAMTTISSVQPDVTISIRNKPYPTAKPISDTFQATSFGNYEFKATRPGSEPFYGILPLKFNSVYLALDILFFAPLCLVNLREVYPYYQFEFEKGVVLFKKNEADEWREFRPTQSEADRARKYFETAKPEGQP